MYFTELNNNTLLDHIYQKKQRKKSYHVPTNKTKKSHQKYKKKYINMDKIERVTIVNRGNCIAWMFSSQGTQDESSKGVL